MRENIDNKIISMSFDNRNFEKNISQTIDSLKELQAQINDVPSESKKYDRLADSTKKYSNETINATVNTNDLKNAFGVLEIAGIAAVSRITNDVISLGNTILKNLIKPLNQIVSGGQRRATNIENAKFQLKGLNVEWDNIEKSISYGVKDTAYGLDSAARVASQLVASGVSYMDSVENGNGEVVTSMMMALRAISGVAAMTNSTYDDIGSIFTTVSGQGKMMTMQLRQLEARGLNVAAVMGEQLDKSEAEIRDMVSKGIVDFEMFSKAMDSAFGAHAKDANETYAGSLSNVNAALSRIGAEFASPWFTNMTKVFNAIIPILNGIKTALTPIVKLYTVGLKKAVDELVSVLKNINLLEGIKWVLVDIYQLLQPIYDGIAEFGLLNHRALEPLFKGFKDAAKGAQIFGEKAVTVKESVKTVLNIGALLKDIFVAAFEIIVEGLHTLLSFIPDINGETQTFLGKLNSVINGCRSVVKYLKDIIKTKTVDFIKNARNALSKIKWSDVINALAKIANVLATTIPMVISIMAPVINFISSVINGTNNIGDNIKKVALLIAASIVGTIKVVKTKVTDLINGIRNIFNAIPSTKQITLEYASEKSETLTKDDQIVKDTISNLNAEQKAIESTSKKIDELENKATGAIGGSGYLMGKQMNTGIVSMNRMLGEITKLGSAGAYIDNNTSIIKSNIKSSTAEIDNGLLGFKNHIFNMMENVREFFVGIKDSINNGFDKIKGFFVGIKDTLLELDIPWGAVLGVGALALVVGNVISVIYKVPIAILKVVSAISTAAGGYAASSVLSGASMLVSTLGTAMLKFAVALFIFSKLPVDKLREVIPVLAEFAAIIVSIGRQLSYLYLAIGFSQLPKTISGLISVVNSSFYANIGQGLFDGLQYFGKFFAGFGVTLAGLALLVSQFKDDAGKFDSSGWKEISGLLIGIGVILIGVIASVYAFNTIFNKSMKINNDNGRFENRTITLFSNTINASSLGLFAMAAIIGELLLAIYEFKKLNISAGEILATLGGISLVILTTFIGIALLSNAISFGGLQSKVVQKSLGDKNINILNSTTKSLSSSLLSILGGLSLLFLAIALFTYVISAFDTSWTAIGLMITVGVFIGLFGQAYFLFNQNIEENLLTDKGNFSTKRVEGYALQLSATYGPLVKLILAISVFMAVVSLASLAFTYSDVQGLIAAGVTLVLAAVGVGFILKALSKATASINVSQTNNYGKLSGSLYAIMGIIISLTAFVLALALIGSIPDLNWGAIAATYVGAILFVVLITQFTTKLAKVMTGSVDYGHVFEQLFGISAILVAVGLTAIMIAAASKIIESVDSSALGAIAAFLVGIAVFTGIVMLLIPKMNAVNGAEVVMALEGIALLIASIGVAAILIAMSAKVLEGVSETSIDAISNFLIGIGALSAILLVITGFLPPNQIAGIISVFGGIAILIGAIALSAILFAASLKIVESVEWNSAVQTFVGVIAAISILALIAAVVIAVSPQATAAIPVFATLAMFILSFGVMALLLAASIKILSSTEFSMDLVSNILMMIATVAIFVLLADVLGANLPSIGIGIVGVAAFSLLLVSVAAMGLLVSLAITILSGIAFGDGMKAIGMLAIFTVALVGITVLLALLGAVIPTVTLPLLAAFAAIAAVLAGLVILASLASMGMMLITSVINSAKDMGRNTGENFGTGLQLGLDSATDDILKTADSIVKRVNSVFEHGWDIHSPSKVGDYFARMFGAGLEQGILEKGGDAVEASDKIAKAIPNVVQKDLKDGNGTVRDQITTDMTDTLEETKDIAVTESEEIGSSIPESMTETAGKGMDGFGSGFVQTIKSIFSKAWDVVKGFFSGVGELFRSLPEIISGELSIGDALKNMFDLGSITDDINNALSGSGLANAFNAGALFSTNGTYDDPEQVRRDLEEAYTVLQGMQNAGASAEAIAAQQKLIEDLQKGKPPKSAIDYPEIGDLDDWLANLSSSGGGGGGSFDTSDMASDIYGSSGVGSGIGDGSAGSMGASYVNSNNTYTFVQNNYSPEPLTRADIYLQTQKQFDSWAAYNE